jgi:DNA-binding NtrC family response regulator
MLLAEQDVIGPEHLPADLRAPLAAAPRPAAPESGPVGGAPLLPTLEAVEREHVLRVLTATGGNRDETSRVLGISRRTLTRMIQRWDLPRRS